MQEQPGVAAGNMGRELGTRAKPKLKVAGQDLLLSAYCQLQVTGVDDDGAIVRWAIDGIDVPALVSSRLLGLRHAGSMPWTVLWTDDPSTRSVVWGRPESQRRPGKAALVRRVHR